MRAEGDAIALETNACRIEAVEIFNSVSSVEIPPTPLVKGGSESLKVPFDKGDLGGSARI